MHKFIGAFALALALQFVGAGFAAAALNLNTATKEELVALNGIGPAKAQAILDYRKANGPFKSVDDLRNVKGIGAKRLEKLRPELAVVNNPTKVAAAPAAKVDPRSAGPSTKGDVKSATESKPRR
ncbi:MAG: helix-hairpin-helix domain-containing protein [Betaproteobacteria bacterium]